MSPNVKIRRQQRKSVMMRPVPGGFEVFIPHWMRDDDPQLKKIIADGLKKLEQHAIPEQKVLTTEHEIRTLVQVWSKKIGVKATRVQFRQMVTRWGSCSSRGTVTLNRALTWLPFHLAEYVVVHELVHLIELNHGKGFHQLMAKHLPDYEERQAEMHRNYSTFGKLQGE